MRFSVRTLMILLASVLVASAATVFVVLGWTLRSGSDEIRQDLLKETPLGSSASTVLKKLKDDGRRPVTSAKGFLRQPSYSAMTVVGDSSIRAELGDYRVFPFPVVTVTAFWGFDGDGKLIDVWVWKTTDSI